MKSYMHIHTGSVDEADVWIGDIGQEDFDRCVKDGSLVEVLTAKQIESKIREARTLDDLHGILEEVTECSSAADLSAALHAIGTIDLTSRRDPVEDPDSGMIAFDDWRELWAGRGYISGIHMRDDCSPDIITAVVSKAGGQDKAAEALGVSQASISRYLDGLIEPRRSVLMLAVAYLK